MADREPETIRPPDGPACITGHWRIVESDPPLDPGRLRWVLGRGEGSLAGLRFGVAP